MNPNKALWEKGDFTRIAATMRKSGEALASRLEIVKGMQVLELGGGDGTTAIPLAKTGADVTVIDIAENLVKAGNTRANDEGLPNCVFREGDASHLSDIPDASFDATLSIFGAMFAPRPFDVAKEMVRVTKPGGKILMGNWIPGDPTLVAQLLKISAAYTPPPPEGFISPMTWGIASHVIERFEQAGVPKENITFSREPWTFDAPYGPVEFAAVFRHFYGPTMTAFEAAEKNNRSAELQQELEKLFTAENKSGTPNYTAITATYLLVTVKR
ncbi:class I SAM-dependent methyltransferase [Niabella pedocola]|uniref:Class I SAM-dependent methyltransferase n=1 Tax=Niabella pedocola TaxID=1752077 RepID=A0ABS8PUN0_9BACT|nr:class I SAM-dependent methyltransferase [Niabella pedocola]MCD2424769.1 class I SAM-dependent methyltransferase [Niabella pedocola]